MRLPDDVVVTLVEDDQPGWWVFYAPTLGALTYAWGASWCFALCCVDLDVNNVSPCDEVTDKLVVDYWLSKEPVRA